MFVKRVRRYLRRFRKLFVCVCTNHYDSEKRQKDEIYHPCEFNQFQVIYENINAPLISAKEQEAILQTSKLMSEFADNSLEMFAHLPDVPLLTVFSYLNRSQILELLIICKRWHSLVMSAVNQLPKVDVSLVITENPYANLHFDENQNKVRDSPYTIRDWTIVVGEKKSTKMDLTDDDGEYTSLYSYEHFKTNQIIFQDCTPSSGILDAVGMALSRNRAHPSMLWFAYCTLSLEVEPALINLLREFKNDIKVIVFKGCYAVDAITDNLVKELDQVEQFFVDPYTNGELTSVTDTALDNIARNFKTRPFHLTLPSKAFTQHGLQTFVKAICSEGCSVNINSTYCQGALNIEPSSLKRINNCPEYEMISFPFEYATFQSVVYS